MAMKVDVYSGTKKKSGVTYGSSEYWALLKDGYKLTSTSSKAVSAAGLSTSTKQPSSSTKTSTTTAPKTSTTSAPKASTPAPAPVSSGVSKSTIASLPNMEPGASGANVATLQRYLVENGYMTQAQMNTGAGTYGPQTTAAVAKWQKDMGVNTAGNDGYFGPATKSKIGSSSSTPSTPTPAPSTGGNTSLKDLSIGLSNGSITNQSQLNSTKPTPTPSGGTATTGGGSNVYPMGEFSLIRFEGQGPAGYMNDQTIWLVDPSTSTLRPFSNSAALENFFDGPVDINNIVVRSAADLMPGGALGSQGSAPGYQILSNEFAIKPDGTAKRLDYSNAQLASRYGYAVNEELEQSMYMALKGSLDLLQEAGVDQATLNSIKKSDATMAYYVSAMAYGGYSLGDIYSDVKRKELGISNLSPISSTADKASYAKTAEYQKASGDSRIQPPPSIGGINTSQLSLPIYQLPDEAFKTLVPILDYNSQQFKDAMAQVETSYYDVLEQQLKASTEQEKAVADYNYQEWKGEVERNYGIQLSDNALEAWNQIQQAYTGMSERGIMNSGIQNEGIDNYLQRVRREDQRARDDRMSKEEQQQMNYFLTAASSAEINQLVQSDPDKAKAWGLIPSDDVKNSLSLAALKEKYPNAKEEDLQQYISILLDENGNYRSQIYQKQLGNLGDLDPNSASLNTLTGINTAKESFQEQEALRKSLLSEEEAYKEFTKPDVAFLRNNDPQAFEDIGGVKQSGGTVNLSSIIKQAGGGLSSGQSSNISAPNTPAQKTSTGSTSTNAAMAAQLAEIQKKVNDIKARTTTTTPASTYTAPKVSTTPTASSGPSAALKAMSIANSPNQSKVPTTVQSKYGGSTISQQRQSYAPQKESSTIGGAIKNTWNKLWGK